MSVELPADGAAQKVYQQRQEPNRRRIRQQAYRLFREQGYNETTIEQIAAASGVSPSVVLRYFATKEQLVLATDLDSLMTAALGRQPRDAPAKVAFRDAAIEVFRYLPAAEVGFEQERRALLNHVPELRSAIGVELLRNIDVAAELLADRSGRSADDFEVRVSAGAIAGAVLAIWTMTPMNVDNITRIFDLLDAGLPLGSDRRS
ncbi:TetR/AcrR family transcriptional regulator [Nocardia sp. CNY236]|uniref:TetR/AcrR family transcriptional regulator n=1 Tax=Nocardia sp. CNY236 TaxID=1169152 RepID=UPI000490C5FE|nr:TetR family transcriptional regulator [Nocardia sp. CNY236]